MKKLKYILCLLVLSISVDVFAQTVEHPLDQITPNPKVGNIIFAQQVQCSNAKDEPYATGDEAVGEDQCGCNVIMQSRTMLWDGAVASSNDRIEPVPMGANCNAVQHRIYPLEVTISDLASRACKIGVYAYELLPKNSKYYCKADLPQINEDVISERNAAGTCDDGQLWKDACKAYGVGPCKQACDCPAGLARYNDAYGLGVGTNDRKKACWTPNRYDTVQWHKVCRWTGDVNDSTLSTPNVYPEPYSKELGPKLEFFVIPPVGVNGSFELVKKPDGVVRFEAPKDGVSFDLLGGNTKNRWSFYEYFGGTDIYRGSRVSCTDPEGCNFVTYGPYDEKYINHMTIPNVDLVRQTPYLLQRVGCDVVTGINCDIPLGEYKVRVRVTGLHGGDISANLIYPVDSVGENRAWDDRPGNRYIPAPPGGHEEGENHPGVCDWRSTAGSKGCPHEAICTNVGARATLSYKHGGTGQHPDGAGRIAESKTVGNIKPQVYFIRGVAAEISRPEGLPRGKVIENYDGNPDDYNKEVATHFNPGVVLNDAIGSVDGAYGEIRGGYLRFEGVDDDRDTPHVDESVLETDLFAIDVGIDVSSLRSLKMRDSDPEKDGAIVMPISPYDTNNAGNTATQMKELGDKVNIFTKNVNSDGTVGGGTEAMAWCSGVSQAVNVLRYNNGCTTDDDRCVLFVAVANPPIRVSDSQHEYMIPTRWGSNYNADGGVPDRHNKDRIKVDYPNVNTSDLRPLFYDCVQTAVQQLKDEGGKVIVVVINPDGDDTFVDYMKRISTDSSLSSSIGLHTLVIGRRADETKDENGNSLEATEADMAAETLWTLMPRPIEICQGASGCGN